MEYPKSMFSSQKEKNNVSLVNPTFSLFKVGFSRVFSTQTS